MVHDDSEHDQGNVSERSRTGREHAKTELENEVVICHRLQLSRENCGLGCDCVTHFVLQNMAREEGSTENCGIVFSKIGWVVLLDANPIINEASCL